MPILNPYSDGFTDNRGVGADRCGNIWYVTNTFNGDQGTFTGQPIIAVSIDKGVTFQTVFIAPPPGPNEFYDFPQFCFGGDENGQYGLYFIVDFVQGRDTVPFVGFIPIFDFNDFGAPSTALLTNFLNNIRRPAPAASCDGRVWFQGRSFSGEFTGRHLSELIFKSPGALNANYAGPWNVAIINELSHQDSQPVEGYNLVSVLSMLYDEKRQALYALTAVTFPDFSQNMRIYFVISRDNGQTWTNPIDISTTDFANRGFQSMALDSKTGDLILGWYDGRNDSSFQALQYFGARIPAKKLDKLVNAIPLSNPLYSIPSPTGQGVSVKSEAVVKLQLPVNTDKKSSQEVKPIKHKGTAKA